MKRLISAFIISSFAALACADYRMIVRIKPDQTPAALESAAAALGGVVADKTPNAPFALFSLPDDPMSLMIQQMAIATGVVDVLWTGEDTYLWSAESVSRGNTISVISTNGTPTSENENYLDQVNWSPTLAASDGRTVKVAILDSGLSRRQIALWSKVDAYIDVFHGNADDVPTGKDTNGNGIFDEGVGHGTMVAGLVNAVAPKVRLVVAKVADSDGRASAWGIVKGIAFAVGQGCEVANVSLASPEPLPAFNAAASWARDRGLLVVAAIGNANESHAWYPAGDTNALCVTGLNADDTKASFSNYDNISVCAAPAVGLVSNFWNGTLARWSGTSFAAPFVTGAIADCLRRTGPLAPALITQAVRLSGRNIDSLNANYAGQLGKALDIVSLNGQLQAPAP